MVNSNTFCVDNSTPPAPETSVQSQFVKTIGEKIRQARTALGLSGEALAKKVGYKNQSAIGNLENRKEGTGGNKIDQIANALNVSVDWLYNGPDSENVPFLPPKNPLPAEAVYSDLASEPTVITRGYWPFRTPVETFRRFMTLDNLEILDTQIEIMIRQRSHDAEQARRNNGGK